jgi:malate synthase
LIVASSSPRAADTRCSVLASPVQVWQWIRHGATLQPGDQKLTADRFRSVMDEELAGLRKEVGV